MDKIELEVYHRWDLFKSKWAGIQAAKNPCDAWIYQEIIFDMKPEVVVECGTFQGGGAMFFSTMLKMVHEGGGTVVSIDKVNYNKPRVDNIKWLTGKTIDSSILGEVERISRGKKSMVILDSDHEAEYVRKEMEAYAQFVSPGQYMIVEDTCWRIHEGGPLEAVEEFLSVHPEFSVDSNCERFGITNNPGGFLKKNE